MIFRDFTKTAAVLALVVPMILFNVSCEESGLQGENKKKSDRDSDGANNGGNPNGGDNFGNGSNGQGGPYTQDVTQGGDGYPNSNVPPGSGYQRPNNQWGIPGMGFGSLNGNGNTPLVLDMNRDGQVSLATHKVMFDLEGNGKAISSDWVSAQEGFLAIDLNNNGQIDSGKELFGSGAVLHNSFRSGADGFTVLAQYDSDHNNLIDHRDQVFSKLLIWQDKNLNGQSEKNELSSLSKTDIKRLSLDYQVTAAQDGFIGKTTRVGQWASYQTSAQKSYLLVDVYFNTKAKAFIVTAKKEDK